jgi:hypothetical protein
MDWARILCFLNFGDYWIGRCGKFWFFLDPKSQITRHSILIWKYDKRLENFLFYQIICQIMGTSDLSFNANRDKCDNFISKNSVISRLGLSFMLLKKINDHYIAYLKKYKLKLHFKLELKRTFNHRYH